MEKRIAILPGDGIGPEVTKEAIKVLDAIGEAFNHKFTFNFGLVGADAIDKTGDPFPKETEQLCNDCDAILFGAIGLPKYDNDPNAPVRPEQGLLRMRKELGLYANIRPVKSYPGLLGISPLKEEKVKGVDFVVFRELTGGIYFGKPQGRSKNGEIAYDTCQYSKDEILRITKLAFEAARKRKMKVTLVDKANVLETSRLWRETVKEYAASKGDIELDFMFVDNAAMQIIQNPGYFDVLLTENMFGDIITDEASVITGSLGMLPSASIGDANALYEPVHGSYPQVAGQNRANPIASILSVAMLLDHSFSLEKESLAIIEAVNDVINVGILTEDMVSESPSSTEEVGNRIVEIVKLNSLINAN